MAVCGLAKDVSGNQILVYGGGSEDEEPPMKTVDVFNFASKSWSRGQDLPYGKTGSANVPYGDTFLTVGGQYDYDQFYDDIWIFDTASQSFKEFPGARLGSSRSKHIALLVPDNFSC